jgi:seryl-tRNA synthetase
MCVSSVATPAGGLDHPFTMCLVEAGLLVPSGVLGVFGKNGVFEAVVQGIDALVVSRGADLRAEVFRFPPVISRALLEQSEYLGAFPQLIGSVHSFTGDDAAHASVLNAVEQGADWGPLFSSTQVVLTPAACYPVYQMASGTLPTEGRIIDVASSCFRHEPSIDPSRMQSFRMHELVRLGSADDCVSFRDLWLQRGLALLDTLDLMGSCVPANDPFFGRRGRLLSATQREQQLKFELVVLITSDAPPTAVASANWHQDHFGHLFDITQHDGAVAHTACVGFGLERLALALFKTHGTSPAQWSSPLRAALAL